ncbi:MAG: cellulase family glycosylhydrolase [Chloroflexi bacterium]|nr:cellulase family glycosylhydrolase [Chloroflexota bacterium]
MPNAHLLARILLLLLASVMVQPGAALADPARVSGDRQRLLAADGQPWFLVAVNYEGPFDRAWQMWEDGQFDEARIDQDFARAATAGVQAIRIFVQPALQKDLAKDQWQKLDTVVALAEKRNLQLIVSLHDDGDPNVAAAAQMAGKIAARLRGRRGVLAYDVKNEPRFGDLALGRYETPPALQKADVIAAYGERLPRAEVAAYRQSDDGKATVPSRLTDDQAWVYVNVLRLYREFLAEGAAWAAAKGGGASTVDFARESAQWKPFLDAYDATLRAWLTPQVEALRKADPTRPVTVDHVDAVLASLPANSLLDYQTFHRYSTTTAASIRATLALVRSLRSSQPNSPFVLGEFGIATETVDPARAGLVEAATYLGLLAENAAGGVKWMLNDMPEGYNMRERTLGMFDREAKPKPVVGAMNALAWYTRRSGASVGKLTVADDGPAGLRYAYVADDAVALGGTASSGGPVRLIAESPVQALVTWTEPVELRVWVGGKARLTLGPTMLPDGAALQLRPQDSALPGAIQRLPDKSLQLDLPGAGWYLLPTGATPRPVEYDIPNGRFFTQTNGQPAGTSSRGFRVTNDDGVRFWDAFNAYGGTDVLGYPVTRRFSLDGFTVQAFQKAVLQWRPDQGNVAWLLNTFDALHDAGKDDWLETYRQTPRPADTAPDAGLAWEQVMARHIAFLDKVPAALRSRYLAEPEWLARFGLPVSTAEYPDSVVVRGQRATLQLWKEDRPWAVKGQITVSNGGDLAKEAGLWPWLASTPENAPK